MTDPPHAFLVNRVVFMPHGDLENKIGKRLGIKLKTLAGLVPPDSIESR
jgi:hypothetical protein